MYSYSEILAAARNYKPGVVIEMLENNIREETAKKNKTSGKSTIIKNLIKYTDSYREEFKKALTFDNETFYFCDCHRIFKTNSSFGYDINNTPFNGLQNMIPDVIKSVNDQIELNKTEINAFIKLNALRRGNYSSLNNPFFLMSKDGEIYAYNPFYLIDLIDFTGCQKLLVSGYKKPAVSEDGNALILPINHNYGLRAFGEWRAKYFGDSIPATCENIPA